MELMWPAQPQIKPAKARPAVRKLPEVQVITFSIYGTLVAIAGGDLMLVHPNDFIMETALDKTIQEFKMWQSMSRKPGRPSEQMARTYKQICDDLRVQLGSRGERYPELRCELIWERIVGRLVKNDYSWDEGFYGPVESFCQKIAYFFHSNLQGIGPQPNALAALRALRKKGLKLGLLAHGQCFSRLQLLRCLRQQGKLQVLGELFDLDFQVLSCECGARKPSERIYRAMVQRLGQCGLVPKNVLHVGPHIDHDVAGPKRFGFRTALYAGDKAALVASAAKLKEPVTRPELLITDLKQLVDAVGQ